MENHFTRKLWKIGGSYVVTVPRYLIDVGAVKEGNEYTFTIQKGGKV